MTLATAGAWRTAQKIYWSGQQIFETDFSIPSFFIMMFSKNEQKRSFRFLWRFPMIAELYLSYCQMLPTYILVCSFKNTKLKITSWCGVLYTGYKFFRTAAN